MRDRIIKVKFTDIPAESTFAIFDKDSGDRMVEEINPGDTEFELAIPDEWTAPYKNLRTKEYYIAPNPYLPIGEKEGVIEFTGDNYYIDINRDEVERELNQNSVEQLICKIVSNDAINGRQKFYVALVSLESYFEHLVYEMLLLTEYKNQSEFEGYRNQHNRIDVAFSRNNTNFLSDNIAICPGKENLGSIISQDEMLDLKNIFQKVRDLRNDIVHSWGYKDLDREEIERRFAEMGEQIPFSSSQDDFYERAAHLCIRLYAKSNILNNQLAYFREKTSVRDERLSRGYR